MDHTTSEPTGAVPPSTPRSEPADAGGFVWSPTDGVITTPPGVPVEHPYRHLAVPTHRDRGPAPFARPRPEPAPSLPSTAPTERPPDPWPPRRPEARRPLYHYPADAVATQPEEPPRRSFGTLLLGLVAGIVGALAAVGALWGLGAFDDPAPAEVVADPPVTVIERVRTEILPSGEATTNAVAVARKVVPSIVRVEVGDDTAGGFVDFGAGSGVVLTEDGLIVTNHHVIEDTVITRVVFQDGRIYEAAVVGSDPLTDLAVLSIEAEGLVPIEIGNTTTLEIGSPAIAVGNPLALTGGASLTLGVISAFNREVDVGPTPSDRLFGMLQTDAPITQGSSGGALVDDAGRLIGITTAIGVSSAGAEGIGFAIPVELVTRITDEIIETGRVHHAFLGILGNDYFEEADDGSLVPGGAVVVDFAESGSAARDAGILAGDRIVSYDGQAVAGMQDLINGLRHYRVGDEVDIEVVRDGEVITTPVVLAERPAGE